jgi:DNA mismatch repair protein MutS
MGESHSYPETLPQIEPAGAAVSGVLFADPLDEGAGAAQPNFFHDLNLDQVVRAVTAGFEEYDLEAFFNTPLRTVEAVDYRQRVCRDLDGTPLAERVGAFAKDMQTVRRCLHHAGQLRDIQPARRWMLDAAELYCRTVRELHTSLQRADLESAGLRGFRAWLGGHLDSRTFNDLKDDAAAVLKALSTVSYTMTISGLKIKIRRYEDEENYSSAVVAAFEKFSQGAVQDYRTDVRPSAGVGHIEARVLDKVARLFPEPFAALEEFCRAHAGFIDPVIATFDRHVQFYVSWLRHIRPLRAAGLEFCYPELSTGSKALRLSGLFDVALAGKLVGEGVRVVRNDLDLSGEMRLAVVTGPNQGGKTTFARAIGQICHVARLGLPVPGTSAQVFLCDAIHTHFERGENLTDLRGKLHDDLVRVRDILDATTGDTLVILNEIFTSTTVADALDLSTRILTRIGELDALGVCVTFLDELASLNATTVSLVAAVDPTNPTRRTHRIEHRPADGRAYAAALAAKHGLGFDQLRHDLSGGRDEPRGGKAA